MNGDVRSIVSKVTGLSVGVQRVWLKNHDFPGLAMSRSLGDKLAHTVGVVPDPDISYLQLNKEEYEYIVVLGSDGVWDYMSNEQVRN